jgi:dipeptidyl aminopeptidase/acylaminoacyl peptidase
MKRTPTRIAALALLATPLFANLCWGAAPSAGPLAIERIFAKPSYFGARLSPSGRYLAVVTPSGKDRGVGIIDLDQHQIANTIGVEGTDVLSIEWQNENRLILATGNIQQVAGEIPRQNALLAVDRDGGAVRHLAYLPLSTSYTDVHPSFERPGSVTLERILPGGDEVILGARDRDRSSKDLYRFDTRSGAKTLLTFDSPGSVSDWVTDYDGVPRAVVADDLAHDTSAWYVRKSAGESWVKVEQAPLGRLETEPMQFSPDGKILYVSSRRQGADRAAIYEYHVDDGQWGDAIVRHPERDVDGANSRFLASYRARKILGLRYTTDRPAVAWFDPDWARIQKSVDAALPGTLNEIQGSVDSKRWLIVAHSDHDPGTAYLLDAKTMKIEKLFTYWPDIDASSLATTGWVRYPARDGLVIPALLTAPPSREGTPAPLVVLIHGGPNVEATELRFSPEIQFLVSRGYAVLQPQFRGTSGFGHKLFAAGFRRWGDEMQDDLEDGVRWAVTQKIADPNRVCFYGASYGGYAAAWGAIKNANLIQCAIDYVGVTSIEYLFDNAQTDLSEVARRSTLMAERIGDPKTDRERFRRVSPLNQADKVGVPILLAYGGSDLRVPLVHGTDFRDALERFHKNYEWVQYGAEGHGFRRDEDVFDFYGRVDRFLAKYLH